MEKAKNAAIPVADVVKAAVIDTGYELMLKEERTEEAEGRLLNLDELVNAAAETDTRGETLRDFLDHAALVSDADQYKAEAEVTLMTMHSAKGLEFPLVFIVGLEENLFPHSRASNDLSELEEERRLCYVAITRAEKYLYLTHAMKRRTYGEEIATEPSRFLNEFPIELIEDLSKGPSWLRFANKVSTKENLAAIDALTGRAPQPVKRTSNYQGQTYNSRDSINEFFKRQGVKLDSEPAKPKLVKRDSGESARSSSSSEGSGKFKVGMRVRHAKFGVGLVVKSEGEDDNVKLTINFPGYGLKKMVEKFAGLEKA
jgi:DNA helicase-2/ATP-dependent DNA helicase PcrA